MQMHARFVLPKQTSTQAESFASKFGEFVGAGGCQMHPYSGDNIRNELRLDVTDFVLKGEFALFHAAKAQLVMMRSLNHLFDGDIKIAVFLAQ